MDLLIEQCRELKAADVIGRLHLAKDRERHKWECPACGSSDALHDYAHAGSRYAHCFSCAKGYDAIALVEETLRLDFPEAVRWIAAQFGLEEEADTEEVRRRIAERREKRLREKAAAEADRKRRHQIGRRVFDRLWPMLTLGPSGRRYLSDRGIEPHIADHIGIRSVESMGEWKGLLADFYDEELVDAGLRGQSDGGPYPVPWVAPFLVLPYWLRGSGLDLLRFRSLGGDGPKYLSPLRLAPQVPFLSHAAYELDPEYSTLFVCEGEINALSVVLAGAGAISSCGGGVWKDEWSDPWKKFERVVVVGDGDEAGEKFVTRVLRGCLRVHGRQWVEGVVTAARFPRGRDANDMLCEGSLWPLIHGLGAPAVEVAR